MSLTPTASEASPLLGDGVSSVATAASSSRNTKSSLRIIFSVFVVISAAILVVCTVGYYEGSSPQSATATTTTLAAVETSSNPTENLSNGVLLSADTVAVTISVTNEYSNRPDFTMFQYPFLNGAHLMEPFRESTVSVSGLYADCGVTWTLEPVEDTRGGNIFADSSTKQTQSVTLSGYSADASSFTVLTAGTGKFKFKLQQLDCSSGADATEYEFLVWVKYVRRELMSLTDRDREEFLDAMKVLWKVNTVDGKVLYGDEYKSVYYLAVMHNDAGSNGFCDEFHGGAGFVNNHVLFGAYFEQSLQLVNPRTCLHYMEYTKYFEAASFQDGHREHANDGGTWTELMTAKWFGSSDPYTGRIIDGRWASSPTPFLDDAFLESSGVDKHGIFFPDDEDEWYAGSNRAHMFNPYGLLRSAWNFSPDPFVLRFNNVARLPETKDIPFRYFKTYSGVTCTDYQTLIQGYVIDQPLESCMYYMEGVAHGNVHFTIGGSGGELSSQSDKKLREVYNFTNTELLLTSRHIETMRKAYITLWRAGKKSLMMCSKYPFDYATGTLSPSPKLGTDGAVTCNADPNYLKSDDTMNEFLVTVLGEELTEPLLKLDADMKRDMINLLVTRMQFDGDLAGSSGALDPMFWVFHGALERLFQRILFENVLSNTDFTTYNRCSGHSFDGKKFWLKGFSFEDRSVDPTSLTNQQLIQILNPLNEEYATHMSFVYESGSWDWCQDFESYFD